MVLCINAGAKVILFIGSTILFTNLLSRNVMIFNICGIIALYLFQVSLRAQASYNKPYATRCSPPFIACSSSDDGAKDS